jgi:hypothetical protein
MVADQVHIEQVHGNRTKKMVIQTYKVQSHFYSSKLSCIIFLSSQNVF